MKTTREVIKEFSRVIESEELSEGTKDVFNQVVVHMIDQSYQLDKSKQKVYTYEALLYETGKEKFIIEEDGLYLVK